MKKIITLVSGAVLLSPLLAFAQQQLTDINSVANKATNIGNLVIGLAISLAVIWIIINIIRYLIAGADGEARKKGGYAILFGVVGLFVILSIWGLVTILRNSFGTQNQVPLNEIHRTTNLPTPPQVP